MIFQLAHLKGMAVGTSEHAHLLLSDRHSSLQQTGLPVQGRSLVRAFLLMQDNRSALVQGPAVAGTTDPTLCKGFLWSDKSAAEAFCECRTTGQPLWEELCSAWWVFASWRACSS